MKKAISILLVLCFALAMFAGCGSSANSSGSSAANSAPAQTAGDSGTAEASASLPEKTGTIMWLSNLTSGPQYEVYKAYGEAICDQLGYNFTIVYGDTFNDAAGNLTAVTNGMTNDVVGLLASQDGGLSSIMEQYPNLYVAGFASDMLSVFGEGRENAGVLNNDHFLGTVCDGFSHGVDIGNQYFEATLQKGYHRVSLVTFPAFAYPALAEAVVQYQARVDEYNATAADADKITVVGEPLTLEFQPLADSYFLEDGKDDLDAIIAFCAGVQFVYPILATAKINGTCDPRTQVVTSGFDDNKDIVADIGDGKTIAWISISPCENIGYALTLLDDAITGNLPSDFKVDCMDSEPYVIASTEDINNVMSKSMTGTRNVALAQIPVEQVVANCGRNNPNFSFADLQALYHSEQITVASLKNK